MAKRGITRAELVEAVQKALPHLKLYELYIWAKEVVPGLTFDEEKHQVFVEESEE